ncbi:helix-turn-helix domain-containing protein [Avibacterium paragallinarum]|uniref:XRE family transcriptional regulator n=1 Tax=Avibacterium paragallinarum TaxID=728 RepID=A0A8B3T5Q0_AVIPA|nr:helix-turn-helix transcriptional regulator [Avibacterium paragallinarum]RZN54168.1 XRE family transcriptional regulator [Avibacterium paragallinarum]
MKNIAKRIKEIREQKGISREDLADNLHIPVEVLIGYEEGLTKLSTDLISEFAFALEVSEDYLRVGDSQNNTLNSIQNSELDNSTITTTHSTNTTTNNYYAESPSQERDGDNSTSKLEAIEKMLSTDKEDRNRLRAQLDTVEQKLDTVIQHLLRIG